MSNNLDQLFKKALQYRGSEPPAEVWEKIGQHLNRQGRKKMLIWWRGMAAGIALLAAIAGMLLVQQQEEYISVAEMYKPTPPTVINEFVGTVVVTTNQSTRSGYTREEQKLPAPAEYPGRNADKSGSMPGTIRKIAGITLENTSLSYVLDIPNSRRGFIPLTSKSALENHMTYQHLLSEPIVPQPKSEKEQVKFAISGHVVPGYASGSYSSSLKNTRGSEYASEQMEGLVQIGGGLKFAVSAGKKLAIQTGLFYSRIGQKTTNSGASIRAVTLSAINPHTISTPLGNVRGRTQAVGYRTAGATLLNSIGNADEGIEQAFGTLEIPLSVRYQLNDNKIRFYVTGGFSGNIIVSNKVYLQTGSGKEFLGSTEEIRDFSISTDCGLGVEYPLGRNVKLMLEPGFKYYLQSLSKNEDINFKPYMFSLSTGIGIEF